jgi:ABC-type transport system involved in multi-copper enzyme maturation permease subunit
MVAVFSTVLATSLAHHLAGHLEIAWTKPIARERLILETMIVDAAAIAIAYFGTLLVMIGIVSLFAGKIPLPVTSLGLRRTASELLFIFAFYTVIQAVTSGQRRMAATVAGVAWPVLLFLIAAPSMGMPVPITRGIELLNYLNPLALLAVNTNDGIATNMLRMQIWGLPALLDASALIALGLLVTIVRWRRIEV